jgi:CHAT domain-containing protein
MVETARRVSDVLLRPVSGHLGRNRLVIVVDGILQSLPFAALPDPAMLASGAAIQPLILRHEIVYLPSMSVLATLREELRSRTSPPQTLAVFADPVFSVDDERVRARPTPPTQDEQPSANRAVESVNRSADEIGIQRDGGQLVRLIGTRREAEGLAAMVPGGEARQAFDFEASRELATSGELSRYRYVHFATHGMLNNIHPELTGIVLSLVDSSGSPQDGFLRAHEVYNLRIPADVVVLSGCQTGLGKDVKGEGLIGLTRGFLYAGAPRVVVSLWKVDDDATAELMVGFYRGMLHQGKRPADALRAAQIAMWKKDKWQAPYFWAAFVLQGEWR